MTAFLILALLLSIFVSAAPRLPATEWAACVAMSVTLTALYYWLPMRPRLRPKAGMLIVAVLGFLHPAFTFGLLPGPWWMAIGADAALIALVLTENVPFADMGRLLAGEVTVLRCALDWRMKPDVPPGLQPLALERREGQSDLILMIGLAALFEAIPVHLMVAHWSTMAAWLLTGLSMYCAIWILALYRSFALRPSLVGDGALWVRYGLLFSLRIPFDSVRGVSRSPAGLRMEFSEPLEAKTMLGLTRSMTEIALLPGKSGLEAYIDHLAR